MENIKDIEENRKLILKRLSGIKKEDYFKKANLHTHSNFSDGKEDFDKLIESAISLNMEHFSIADHNTLKGYQNSKYKNHPVLIPAVEFDCFYLTSLIHILGYGVDINNPEIQAVCTKNDSETKFDIIRLFHSRHPKKAIEAIHKAGGAAVLAHPCCSSVFSLSFLVKKLKSFGLDGIEAYYPYNRHRGIIKFHSRKKPFKIAEKYGLILTGGTDEHGKLSTNTEN